MDDSVPSLNAVRRDKKSASVRQIDVPTNFSLIDPDKKPAALRLKIGYCAVAFNDKNNFGAAKVSESNNKSK